MQTCCSPQQNTVENMPWKKHVKPNSTKVLSYIITQRGFFFSNVELETVIHGTDEKFIDDKNWELWGNKSSFLSYTIPYYLWKKFPG